METLIEGSNLIRGSKSRTIRINLTSCIDFTNRENWIKAKKVDGAELRDWLPRAFAESLYKLRSKLKALVKRTKFSDTIVKIAKAILVAKVELEFEQELE